MNTKCSKCSAEISELNNFCPHCGFQIKVAATEPQAPQRIIRPSFGTPGASDFDAKHKKCPNCAEFARLDEISCLWCGHSLQGLTSILNKRTLDAAVGIFLGPRCPLCGGKLKRMDAGGRGTAFAQGNLLGAFSKTHRCINCGHLV